MFQKFKSRSSVSGWKFALIFLTFALGGSFCGYLARTLLRLTSLDGFWWMAVYIIAVTLIWPVCILVVSAPLGQLPFFRSYLWKLWVKITGKKSPRMDESIINIAVFASGAGSNARNLILHFQGSRINVALIVCNKPGAGVIAVAEKFHIPLLMIDRPGFTSPESCLPQLRNYHIQWVVLAGFLWKVPPVLVKAFSGKMINIHPALLPKFGGKGMFGHHVHEAVIEAKESESGITIHFVDELYDHGASIEQVKCKVQPGDTAEMLAAKIHELEQRHFPAAVERAIKAKS